MPILTFKDPNGQMIKVNSPDGSMPSEGELDQLFENHKSLQGGANSPALVKARQNVEDVKSQRAGNYANALGEPVGVAANTALFGIPGVVSKKVSGKDVFAGDDLSPGQKLMAEGAGMMVPSGALLRATGVEKLLGNVAKYAKPKNQVGLAEEVQNGLAEAKHEKINNYGPEYDRIINASDKKVNINAAVKNFVDEGQSIMQNPEFAQQIAVKNPAANKVLDIIKAVTDQKVPEELSAKEADSLAKSIKNLPGIKSKLAQRSKYGFHTVQWTNEDRMLIGLADDIKSGVIEAHPELSALNKDYGTFMNAYKKVAPDFKIGTTVSKLKNYSQLDPQKKALFEEIMPKGTVNKVKDFEKADKTSKLLKSLGLWGVRGAAGAAGFKGFSEIVH